ncbi:hypothetical protein PQQ84_22580 [Paraburkholderia strydomiana]|uniref:hypothetical protein n=1 Tax=Paraburkholderia strydomiana TaxID=1245417 RepID=UPI0038BC17CD
MTSNIESILFDLEMANRRLPAEPTDDSYDGDAMDSSERDEWKSVRSHLPAIIQIVREVKNGKEGR